MSMISGQNINASDFDFMFGEPKPYFGKVAPTNFKICDGSAISRATFASSFAVLVPTMGTVTVTIATPAVFSFTAHGLVAGDPIYLTTTSALPTGLSANTLYYVISAGLTANAFEVSASRGGSAVNTSGSQSGVHTLHYCPFGLGDGSTTYNLPDLRGLTLTGYKAADADMGYLNQQGGEKTHTLIIGEMPSHHHTVANYQSQGVSGAWNGAPGVTNTPFNTSDTGGDGAHNNLQPYATVNWIIRVT